MKKSEKSNIVYSDHAVMRMFERNVSEEVVEKVILEGQIIEEYPKDKPFASFLKMDVVNLRPIHVVGSFDETNNLYYVISLYEPSLDKFEPDYKTRIIK